MREDGTVVSRAYTGKTCRVMRNAYTDEFDATATASSSPSPPSSSGR